MDDNVIISKFVEFCDEETCKNLEVPSKIRAAIRLYRMAEENTMATGLKREGWTCKENSAWNKEVEQARASLVDDLKENLKLAGWREGMSAHQEQEMGDYRRGQIDTMHWMERRMKKED